MLLGQHHRQTLQNFLIVALQGRVQDSVTVDNNEAELVIVVQVCFKWLGVESVHALVVELDLGHEGLEVNDELLFSLAIVQQDDTTEQNEAVVRGLLV